MTNTESAPQVGTYTLKASNGRHIKKATKVTFADGHVIRFMEKMSNREALRQVAKLPVR